VLLRYSHAAVQLCLARCRRIANRSTACPVAANGICKTTQRVERGTCGLTPDKFARYRPFEVARHGPNCGRCSRHGYPQPIAACDTSNGRLFLLNSRSPYRQLGKSTLPITASIKTLAEVQGICHFLSNEMPQSGSAAMVIPHMKPLLIEGAAQPGESPLSS
jgi:hypothetical protein